MTRYQLYINLLSANSRASELERTSARIKAVAADLQAKTAETSANWQGAASKEFAAKGRILHAKLIKEAQSLQQTADTIRRIAKRTYETELKALEMANQRVYH